MGYWIVGGMAIDPYEINFCSSLRLGDFAVKNINKSTAEAERHKE